LLPSVAVFTHVPLQAVCPDGHGAEQTPLTQLIPAGQATPHAPQFWLSVAVLTHTPLQSCWPDEHVTTQEPAMHVAFDKQAVLQLPQL